jgi:hypothetical protein
MAVMLSNACMVHKLVSNEPAAHSQRTARTQADTRCNKCATTTSL